MKKNFYYFFTIIILLNGLWLNAQNTCPNLITNGDFEVPNAGFTFGLPLNAGCAFNTYSITTRYNLKCGNLPNAGDHTTGSGKFLVIQGSNTATNMWATNVTVTPNTPYTFSFWLSGALGTGASEGLSVANLAMVVNGVDVPLSIATTNTPSWVKYTYSGTTPAVITNLAIAIRQITAGLGGSDYGIDDISFQSCASACNAEFTFQNINACGNVQFTNTSTLPTTERPGYSWNFGDGTTSTLQSPSHQFTTCGTYNVCMIVDGTGCKDTVCHTVTVSDNTPPVARCKQGVGVTLDGNCQYNVTSAFVDNGSTDNCQIKSLVVNPAIIFGCANTTVTLTVTDWCNNRSTCTMGIQTIETVPPTIVCPPTATVTCHFPGAHEPAPRAAMLQRLRNVPGGTAPRSVYSHPLGSDCNGTCR